MQTKQTKQTKQTIKLENFLVNTEETGRFIVTSKRTGRKYYVEPIGDPHLDWGSVDQSTGKLMTKKGWKKNKGSVEEEHSMITDDIGFDKIHRLSAGMSPLVYIEELDKKYPSIEG